MDEFDINKFEDLKEVFFDELPVGDTIQFKCEYFYQRLKEAYKIEHAYFYIKGIIMNDCKKPLIKGKLHQIHFPKKTFFDKIKQVGDRNSKDIQTYDTVILHFIKKGQKKYELLKLEVKNV